MVTIVPYLLVPNAVKAIELYSQVFDTEEVSRIQYTEEMAQDIPDDIPLEETTMHATIKIGEEVLYMADDYQNATTGEKQLVEVLLELDSKEQITSFYNRAEEHGFTVIMQLEETFWGAWYARLKDPFGIGWQLNLQMEESSQSIEKV